MLLHLSEMDKALIYLSVAAHQNPNCVKYARALEEAQRQRAPRKLAELFARRR